MNETLLSIVKSWLVPDSAVTPWAQVRAWLDERNAGTAVEVRKIALSDCAPWFYDERQGCIRNGDGSFFTVTGCVAPGFSQPMIVQEEIGYLGILCREFDGVMHFLMQAKVEPGNRNHVQIAPTIQATRSNFTRKHGGKSPAYLSYFLDAARYEVVADQLQSEQASRFWKKRNRNIVLRVREDVPLLPSHRWLTLGQIKRLLGEDDLVSMDARTVISSIPFSALRLPQARLSSLAEEFTDKALFCSLFEGEGENSLPGVYRYLNDWKMFRTEKPRLVPLGSLTDWEMGDREIVCKRPYPFKVVFCDVAIEGREVRRWAQPLFEAVGSATFGLLMCRENGILKFLVRAKEEAGCFDGIELGPTLQEEAVGCGDGDELTAFFHRKLAAREGLVYDHMLSEEGGRFYRESNRNVLLRCSRRELPPLPEGAFLLDYRTLNGLAQVNNTLNIQLRNLLSLLEA